ATALLLAPCICSPVAAQTADQGRAATPAAKKAKASKGDKAAKPRTVPSPKGADKGAAAPPAEKAPAKLARTLDPAKLDVLQLTPAQPLEVDRGKLDPKSANTWVVLGFLEGAGGNLAGARESLDRAMALGERRNKAAAAAAAILKGKVHLVGLSLTRLDASF